MSLKLIIRLGPERGDRTSRKSLAYRRNSSKRRADLMKNAAAFDDVTRFSRFERKFLAFIRHTSMSKMFLWRTASVVLEHTVSFVKQIGLQYQQPTQTWITSIFDALMSRAMVGIASVWTCMNFPPNKPAVAQASIRILKLVPFFCGGA